MKKLNLTYIIVAIILGLAFLGYGFLNYQQKKILIEEERRVESEKAVQEFAKETERTRKLSACLYSAESAYYSTWLSNCKNHGFNIEKDKSGEITNCSLYLTLSSSLDEVRQKDKDRCTELYGN